MFLLQLGLSSTLITLTSLAFIVRGADADVYHWTSMSDLRARTLTRAFLDLFTLVRNMHGHQTTVNVF